ncbi:MAG: DUF4179 domain-containing protein [Clostridium sp.]|nr:DUF4179 domain-containing protein [Clostridium sp.]
MKNLDNNLDNLKRRRDNLEVPKELEFRLRQGLEKIPNKKKSFNYTRFIGVAALLVFILGYNADALAYYGKKLVGYDNLMNGTLQELNELGNGQVVDKSYVFENGARITLDAIMLDTNNIVVFQTIFDPNGDVEKVSNDLNFFRLESISGPYAGGGQGEISEDGKTMKWVRTYDAPKFFDKKMKLKFDSISTGEVGEIKFKLDRNQAMTESLKIDVSKTIEIENRHLIVDSLVVSPMSTVIKGIFQNLVELGVDQLTGDTIHYEALELELLADNIPIEFQSSGISSNLNGSKFDFRFETLPKDTKEIELKLKTFGANEAVNMNIVLSKGERNRTLNIVGEEIILNQVYEKNGNTYITLTSGENVFLSSLYLNIDGKEVELEQTIEENLATNTEKDSKKLLRTRTVEFKGTGQDLELMVKKIRYLKEFDQTIYIEKIKE